MNVSATDWVIPGGATRSLSREFDLYTNINVNIVYQAVGENFPSI